MNKWRKDIIVKGNGSEETKAYNLVISSGGLAGCIAAISVAEKDLKVALIRDRQLLGENASSEIRVRTLGTYEKYEYILRKIGV